MEHLIKSLLREQRGDSGSPVHLPRDAVHEELMFRTCRLCFVAVQCTIPARRTTAAACTSVGWTAAEPTATARTASSWRRTGKPAEVGSLATSRPGRRSVTAGLSHKSGLSIDRSMKQSITFLLLSDIACRSYVYICFVCVCVCIFVCIHSN